MSAAGELLAGPARTTFQAQLTSRGHRPTAMVRVAQLGQDAGRIGAADLARREPLLPTTAWAIQPHLVRGPVAESSGSAIAAAPPPQRPPLVSRTRVQISVAEPALSEMNR